MLSVRSYDGGENKFAFGYNKGDLSICDCRDVASYHESQRCEQEAHDQFEVGSERDDQTQALKEGHAAI